jgi:hypothetical protein
MSKKLVTLFILLIFTSPIYATPIINFDKPIASCSQADDHFILTGTTTASGGGQGIDLMLVLDDSGSLGHTDPAATRFNAVTELLNSFGPDANLRLGLAFFTSYATLNVPLGKLDTVIPAINQQILDHQQPSGGTSIGEGIRIADAELKTNGRADATHVIMVFTDGIDGGSNPVEAATAASTHAIVNVVGLGPEAFNQPENQEIANAGKGTLMSATDPQQLAALFRDARQVGIQSVEVKNITTDTIANITMSTGVFTAPIDLAEGKNTIEITAVDTDNQSESASIDIERITEGCGTCPDSPCITPPPPPTDGKPPVEEGQCSSRKIRIRPQVIMAGFDPPVIGQNTQTFDVIATVREGSNPIAGVTVDPIQANGMNSLGLGWPMRKVGKWENGDQVWMIRLESNILPNDVPLANLFGTKAGQFVITIADHNRNHHSFPNLEFGNNAEMPLNDNLDKTSPIYTAKGPAAPIPMVLAAGFDPTLVDFGDNCYKVKAMIRPGGATIKSVTWQQNNGQRSFSLTEEQELSNGDKLYTYVRTFPRGSLSTQVLTNLFGSGNIQSVIEVIDANNNSYQFPVLMRSSQF